MKLSIWLNTLEPQPALSPRSLEGKGAQPTGLTQPEVRFSSRSAFLSPCSRGGDRRACRSAARGTSPCITEAVFGWRFPFPSFGSIPSFPLFLPLTPEGFSVPRVSPERRPAAPPPASPGPAGGSAPPGPRGSRGRCPRAVRVLSCGRFLRSSAGVSNPWRPGCPDRQNLCRPTRATVFTEISRRFCEIRAEKYQLRSRHRS